jgi:hypothetical protein
MHRFLKYYYKTWLHKTHPWTTTSHAASHATRTSPAHAAASAHSGRAAHAHAATSAHAARTAGPAHVLLAHRLLDVDVFAFDLVLSLPELVYFKKRVFPNFKSTVTSGQIYDSQKIFLHENWRLLLKVSSF